MVGVALVVVAALVLPTLALLRADPRRGRPPPVVAPGRRRARRRLGALLGVRRAARLRRAHRLHQRRRPGRPRGAHGAGRPPRSRALRGRDPPRPLPPTPRQPAPDRPARQGRPARVRRELRARSRSRARPSRRGSTPCSTAGTSSCGPPASAPQRLADVADLRRHQLAGALHDAVGRRGSTARGRYDELVASDRFTLSQAFRRAGWRVVDDVPSDDRPWSEGSSFYHYDKVYNRLDVGLPRPDLRVRLDARPVRLAGPAAPRAREAPPPAALRRGRPVSSHEPWTADPAADRWSERRRRLDLQQRCRSTRPATATPSRGTAARSSTRCTRCSRSCEHYGRQEPRAGRAGRPPARDDRHRTRRRATTCRSRSSPTTRRCCAGSHGWGWVDGMRPSPQAPVWPMSAFRNRFLGAFGSRRRDAVVARRPTEVVRAGARPGARRRRSQPRRLAGLDGVRGLAALFVVVNHIFLRAFPGYPVDRAPFWAGWFIYGRFAVVVFIVLSGFSLALSPARHGWRLDGISRFARRRVRRILPPYWAALVFSLAVAWLVVPPAGSGSTRHEVGRRQRPAGAEPRRRAKPEPSVLVDRASRPSCTSCFRCCCCWSAAGALSSWSPPSRSSWRRSGSSARTSPAWTSS